MDLITLLVEKKFEVSDYHISIFRTRSAICPDSTDSPELFLSHSIIIIIHQTSVVVPDNMIPFRSSIKSSTWYDNVFKQQLFHLGIVEIAKRSLIILPTTWRSVNPRGSSWFFRKCRYSFKLGLVTRYRREVWTVYSGLFLSAAAWAWLSLGCSAQSET